METTFARVPLEQVTLREAEDLIEDATWFEKTRLPILFHFSQIGMDDYWSLTVGDHTSLVLFLRDRGLLDG